MSTARSKSGRRKKVVKKIKKGDKLSVSEFISNSVLLICISEVSY